jgi:Lon protease-like protein
MDSEERVLPLFPLNTVLFPGAALPLQIFEERYKQMLQDCLAADSWFGAVLIKEGVEVGGPAVPHTTGTVAEIVQVSDEQRGRFLISCVGRQRFHIKSISDELPYLSGSVELLAEEADQGVTPELTAAVREAVAAYLALASGLGGGWVRDIPVPTEPVSLSYLAAAALQVDTARKQALLEEPTASSRLQSALSLLNQSTEELRRRVEEGLSQRFSRN